MKTSDFDYSLPPELIAQTPAEPRDSSRLMVLERAGGTVSHRYFPDIAEYLREGDILVFNDSRVIPARLRGHKVDGGGRVELLLLRRLDADIWEALLKPAKRLRPGSRVDIIHNDATGAPVRGLTAEIKEVKADGIGVVILSDEGRLADFGELALPPYIHTPLAQPERYQTVYSRDAGSVAAPTAGLHFTPGLLARIENMGVRSLFVTLHVGLDTFRPVREEDPADHVIHQEYAILDAATAAALSRAAGEGRRVICVGTTTVRIVEQAAKLAGAGEIKPFAGWVDLFILPGYKFRVTDALVTNFHLPRSTLLMLVSAFAGRETLASAYREAILQRYRFYSFGDAMLII